MKKRTFAAMIMLAALMVILSPAGFFNSGRSSAQVSSTPELGFIQLSGTTGGELRRHIDISSPWSGGYLFEDMTVIGSATVTESFTMNNLGPGAESDYWKKAYNDFGIGFNVNPNIFPKSAEPAAQVPVSGSVSKPASAVAGESVTIEPEEAGDIRPGFRWFDLF